MYSIEENQNEFQALCKKHIQREGIDQLLEWLETTDFYKAPASSKYHLSQAGGLCQHSLNVYYQMLLEVQSTLYPNLAIPQDVLEQVAILALFHDFVKINFYEETTRNVKNEYGEWIKVPYYSINNRSALSGHGDKSARIVSKFLNIDDDEYMAITHHMGFSSDEARTNPAIINEVYTKNVMAVLLNIADMKATFIDEKEC